MNYFLRALREASKSWPLLAAALLCSAGVAALWGANIAALFPIIEVTLKGDSLQSWNERRIEEAKGRITASTEQIAALETSLAKPEASGDQAKKDRNLLDTLKLSKRGDEAIVYSGERLSPWLDRFLPRDPFNTVLLVVAFVVISTFVKHVLLMGSSCS